MSALRTALLEWDLNRISRVLLAGLAVFLARRFTDGFLTRLGAALLFLFVLALAWESKAALRWLERVVNPPVAGAAACFPIEWKPKIRRRDYRV